MDSVNKTRVDARRQNCCLTPSQTAPHIYLQDLPPPWRYFPPPAPLTLVPATHVTRKLCHTSHATFVTRHTSHASFVTRHKQALSHASLVTHKLSCFRIALTQNPVDFRLRARKLPLLPAARHASNWHAMHALITCILQPSWACQPSLCLWQQDGRGGCDALITDEACIGGGGGHAAARRRQATDMNGL